MLDSFCEANGTLRVREHDDQQMALGAWEEALALNQGSPEPARLAAVTGDVTLWGAGRINVNRARPEVADALMAEVFGLQTADRLQEIRGRGRIRSTENLATQLALNLEQRQKLESLVGTSSDAYTLWILKVTGWKAELHIAERLSQRQAGIVSFVW